MTRSVLRCFPIGWSDVSERARARLAMRLQSPARNFKRVGVGDVAGFAAKITQNVLHGHGGAVPSAARFRSARLSFRCNSIPLPCRSISRIAARCGGSEVKPRICAHKVLPHASPMGSREGFIREAVLEQGYLASQVTEFLAGSRFWFDIRAAGKRLFRCGGWNRLPDSWQ